MRRSMSWTSVMMTLALLGLGGLATVPAHAECILQGDMNGDGAVNNFDIDYFVDALVNGTMQHSCPIHYWSFDGLGRDYGCFQNHAALLGDAAYADATPVFIGIGRALSLDGAGDYADLGTGALAGGQLDDFTLLAWFQTSEANDPDYNTIFSTMTADGELSVVIQDAGDGPRLHVRVHVQGGDTCGLWGPAVVDGAWHQVVVRKAAEQVTLWVDGALWDTCTAPGPLAVGGTWHTAIGCDNMGGPAHFFTGLIDEVKLYDRALNDADIVDLSGMIAYFPFDGDALDATGRGNDGEGVTGFSYVDGVRGSAISFDGATGYALLNDAGDLDGWYAFTGSLWVQPAVDLNSDTGRQDFLYKGPPIQNATSWGVSYDDRDGALALHLMSAAHWFDHTAVYYYADFPADAWFHLAFTYDGVNDVRMYVNGEPVGEVEFEQQGLHDQVWDNDDDLTVGRRTDNQYYFNGAIDELRFYDRELTPVEVQYLYSVTQP